MVHQGQEEAPERPPGRVVGLGGPPQGHEGVVDHFLGQQVLAGDPQGQAVRARGVPAVQLLERVTAARAQPLVQVQVHPVQVVPAHVPTLAEPCFGPVLIER